MMEIGDDQAAAVEEMCAVRSPSISYASDRLRRTGARRGGLPESAPLTAARSRDRNQGQEHLRRLDGLVVVGLFPATELAPARETGSANVAPNRAPTNSPLDAANCGGESGGAAPAARRGSKTSNAQLPRHGPRAVRTGGRRSVHCQGVGYRLIRRFGRRRPHLPMCAGMGPSLVPNGEVGTCPAAKPGADPRQGRRARRSR
jgi:hypothetical protein